MTSNCSLELSLSFKQQLELNLLSLFTEDFPSESVRSYIEKNLRGKTREKVCTTSNTLLTMLLTATQEDKSLQHSINLFKQSYEEQGIRLQQKESKALEEEKVTDAQVCKATGRPKLYKSKLPKSKTHELSVNTVAYSNARGRLPYELVKLVFDSSTDFGELEKETWYGLHAYITDGTYLQLQDTQAIRSCYPPVERNSMFSQALLQVFIRQGTGQLSQYALGSSKHSE